MADVKEEKVQESRGFKLFKKMVPIPYLLALLGLLLPMFTVSCAEKVIAEPTFYEVANGLNLETELKEPAAGYLQKMQDGSPNGLTMFKAKMPDFPKTTPMTHLYVVVAALLLAAFFGFIAVVGYFASLGSLTLGMLAMVSLWAFLSQIGQLCNAIGMNVLSVDPGPGIYCASVLILIGTAMNMASIARPIIEDIKNKKKK